MRDVRKVAEEIVAREGGFVNDPDDPGGATRHGITIGTLRRLGRDIDGDGRVTVADVRRLGREEAIDILIEHYYRRPGIDGLPEALRPVVFDACVNAGPEAVRILQRLLGRLGLRVAVDGVIGPQTRAAAQKAWEMAPAHLVDAYAIERRSWYFRLAERAPVLRKYVRTRSGDKGGWIRRAEAFMAPRYRMSRAEFAERIARWR